MNKVNIRMTVNKFKEIGIKTPTYYYLDNLTHINDLN